MELLDSALHGKKHEVESISYGGGPVSDQLPKSLLEKFPTIASGQGWGLTEVSSAACLVAGRDYLDSKFSIFSLALSRRELPSAKSKFSYALSFM